MGKNRKVRLVSIHDVLTAREALSDPTASRLHLNQESEERDRESIESKALRRRSWPRRS